MIRTVVQRRCAGIVLRNSKPRAALGEWVETEVLRGDQGMEVVWGRVGTDVEGIATVLARGALKRQDYPPEHVERAMRRHLMRNVGDLKGSESGPIILMLHETPMSEPLPSAFISTVVSLVGQSESLLEYDPPSSSWYAVALTHITSDPSLWSTLQRIFYNTPPTLWSVSDLTRVFRSFRYVVCDRHVMVKLTERFIYLASRDGVRIRHLSHFAMVVGHRQPPNIVQCIDCIASQLGSGTDSTEDKRHADVIRLLRGLATAFSHKPSQKACTPHRAVCYNILAKQLITFTTNPNPLASIRIASAFVYCDSMQLRNTIFDRFLTPTVEAPGRLDPESHNLLVKLVDFCRMNSIELPEQVRLAAEGRSRVPDRLEDFPQHMRVSRSITGTVEMLRITSRAAKTLDPTVENVKAVLNVVKSVWVEGDGVAEAVDELLLSLYELVGSVPQPGGMLFMVSGSCFAVAKRCGASVRYPNMMWMNGVDFMKVADAGKHWKISQIVRTILTSALARLKTATTKEEEATTILAITELCGFLERTQEVVPSQATLCKDVDPLYGLRINIATRFLNVRNGRDILMKLTSALVTHLKSPLARQRDRMVIFECHAVLLKLSQIIRKKDQSWVPPGLIDGLNDIPRDVPAELLIDVVRDMVLLCKEVPMGGRLIAKRGFETALNEMNVISIGDILKLCEVVVVYDVKTDLGWFWRGMYPRGIGIALDPTTSHDHLCLLLSAFTKYTLTRDNDPQHLLSLVSTTLIGTPSTPPPAAQPARYHLAIVAFAAAPYRHPQLYTRLESLALQFPRTINPSHVIAAYRAVSITTTTLPGVVL